MTKPANAEGARELAELLRCERARILVVAVAGEQELEGTPRFSSMAKASISVTTPLSASMRPT
jgi:hypothetical protein